MIGVFVESRFARKVLLLADQRGETDVAVLNWDAKKMNRSSRNHSVILLAALIVQQLQIRHADECCIHTRFPEHST